MKIWKKILIALVVILVGFFLITGRKFWILTSLDQKNKSQQANTNVHAKVSTEDHAIEMYRKGDCVKTIMRKNGTNVVLTQLTTPEHRIFYTDDGIDKTMRIYEEAFLIENQNVLVNYADFYTIGEKIVSSIASHIKSEQIDGKDCYVISGFNTNFVYDENATNLKVYIEKETGLAVKMVETIEESGEKKEKVNTYEYQFNTVTDEDVAELDVTAYKLLE